MFVDTSSANLLSRALPTPPERARVKRRKTSSFSVCTPPHTPTNDFLCEKYHNGLSIRPTPSDKASIGSLASLCGAPLACFACPADDGSRRSSTSSTEDLPERQLLPISEIVRDLPPEYTQWRMEAKGHGFSQASHWIHGNTFLPTSLPSLICSSNGSFCFQEPQNGVSWSRAEMPSTPLPVYTRHLASRRCVLSTKHDMKIRLLAPARELEGEKPQKPEPEPEPEPKPKRKRDDAGCNGEIPRTKRSNKKYSTEQEYWTMYWKVDLNTGKAMKWDEITLAQNESFPHDPRSISALQCQYFRTNYQIPPTTPDGLLVLRYDYSEEVETDEKPSEDEDVPDCQVEDKVEGEGGEKDRKSRQKRGKKNGPDSRWAYDGGLHGIPAVEYKINPTFVRDTEIGLRQRFPEVVANENYTWVKPEHREAARSLAVARIQQRLEWREWMRHHHPKHLEAIDEKVKKLPKARKA